MEVSTQYSPNETWDFSANFTFQSGQSYTGAYIEVETMLPGENYGMGHVFPSSKIWAAIAGFASAKLKRRIITSKHSD